MSRVRAQPAVRKRAQGHKARALFVLDSSDPTGYSIEEQSEALLDNWRELFKIELTTQHIESFTADAPEAEGCELVIVNWSTLNDDKDRLQTRETEIVRWAAEHPTALVVLQSVAGNQREALIERQRMPQLRNVIANFWCPEPPDLQSVPGQPARLVEKQPPDGRRRSPMRTAAPTAGSVNWSNAAGAARSATRTGTSRRPRSHPGGTPDGHGKRTVAQGRLYRGHAGSCTSTAHTGTDRGP